MDTHLTKRIYRIREAAEIIGVPQSTLRFWEKEFPDLQPKRTASNQRHYSPQDMELLQIIQFLLHTKGLKLEAAKEYLKHNKKNVSKKLKVIEKLERVKSELEIFLEALNLRNQKI
ncbi:MAG: MerR family transcriptional regulator [Muribaculaceae bacterium]|nr:MerR family transcriptional regulator [Muribaculaceae bacterium]